MKTTKFSIITPSYNQGPFIKKCLNSVQDQNGKFLVEHIILDNCSTDGTKNILEDYQKNHAGIDLHVYIEKDSGQTAAINKGLQIATGDIVCWLNTDEWYEPGTLQKVKDFFDLHPGVDVAFGNFDFIDSAGNLIKSKKEIFFSKAMLMYYGCFIPSCATFVRRSIIDRGLLLRPEFKVAMDFDWYVRIADAGYRFAIINEKLASFILHDSNISSTLAKRGKQEQKNVRLEFSQIRGPIFFRVLAFNALHYYWIAARVIRRAIA